MMNLNSLQTSLSADQLEELAGELALLAKQQSEAMQAAVYAGMSTEEASKYDERRTRITQICTLLGTHVQL